MTAEEIFSQIAQHMVEGLMIHSQMTDYYNFLGFEGYKACHNYHYHSENNNHRQLSCYYLKHYNKIIKELPVSNPHIIPETWYQYTRQAVSNETKKESLKQGFNEWIKWERDTKKFYEQMYQNLISIGEIASAIEVKKYIEDVDYELAGAEQKLLELSSIDYDLPTIMSKQSDLAKKYCKKLKEIELC